MLGQGSFTIAPTTFLEEHWMNFRGADVLAVYDELRARGHADADGTCWLTRDPNGNAVVDVGARPECLRAFRTEMIAKFGAPG